MSELIRLIYASRAEFEPADPIQGVEPNVGRILMQSRRNNKRGGIGGVLYFGDRHFFQVLEGERDAVNETYRRISGDPRHRQLTILSVKKAGQRLFEDWSMKYVPAEQSVREFLAARDYLRFVPLQFSESEAEDLARLFHRQQTGQGNDRGFSWRRLLKF
ncbi:BLUF domain-containing protein [Microbulbifer sediminum]|uniref:BLUF domain-containing protein n=1 Tax=Microbulbifer sediminum TaxID=2904250 RepID=UPI001F208AA8|nr:BLUF domain-containing protein [Microbulbifer sediminum]